MKTRIEYQVLVDKITEREVSYVDMRQYESAKPYCRVETRTIEVEGDFGKAFEMACTLGAIPFKNVKMSSYE